MDKLALAPETGRYSVTFGAATLTSRVAGGQSRARRDQLGAPTTVEVQWLCSYGEFAYLGAFYRSKIKHGSLPFLISLPLGSSAIADQEARFLPGSFQLSAVSGQAYACGASLEVKTPARNTAADLALVAARAAPVDGLPVLALTPSANGYGVQRGETVLATKPGMGPSAMRLDRFNTPSLLSVSWNVGPADWDYLCAFYFSATAEASLPFLIDAVHDYPDPDQLRAMFVPGSFGLASINGLTYSVRAQVEVVPIARPDTDQFILDQYAALGEDWPASLPSLEHLVNVTMPGTFA